MIIKRNTNPIGFVIFPGVKNGERSPVIERYYKNAAGAACIDVCKGHALWKGTVMQKLNSLEEELEDIRAED